MRGPKVQENVGFKCAQGPAASWFKSVSMCIWNKKQVCWLYGVQISGRNTIGGTAFITGHDM